MAAVYVPTVCMVIVMWAIIIIGSHFSGKIAKIFGSNPVAVLATLILLSYAKLLRTAFAVLSYTTLEYPDHTQVVWLYDGNIECLSRKHNPLFTAAMLCLIFPYTLLLIFSQWLQAKLIFCLPCTLHQQTFWPLQAYSIYCS